MNHSPFFPLRPGGLVGLLCSSLGRPRLPSSPFPRRPALPPLLRSRGPAQVLQRGAPSFSSISLTARVYLLEHLLPRLVSKPESSSASTESTRAIQDFHPNRRVLGLYKCSRVCRLLFFHLNSEPNAFNSSLGS
jgi:hypothetical protein